MAADETYEKVVRAFSASFMSDAKWRRLFAAVQQAGLNLPRVEWKAIDGPESWWTPFPEPHDIGERRFNDGRFQPFEYKWIEWFFVPSTYRVIEGIGLTREQDVGGLREAIIAAGKFELEETPEGLRLVAYRR